MSECKDYIGITIGPIFDTMNLVSSPAALWASSYIFSYVTKSICQHLIGEYKIGAASIVTPFCEGHKKAAPEIPICNNSKLLKNIDIDAANRNGIGLYQDRVIFEKGDFDISNISEIKETIIEEIMVKFGLLLGYPKNPTEAVIEMIDRKNAENREFLMQYIMIAAAAFTAENPIMESTKIFDSLELSKSFVWSETENPILAVYDCKEGKTKNEKIKDLAQTKDGLNIDVSRWQLLSKVKIKKKDGKGEEETYIIKSLPYIAKSDGKPRELKKYNYYAVVRSDVDNMSKIISSLNGDDFIKFSATCFSYCMEISDLVKKYGGVTIYAGGDDLLALLPCQHKNDTIFDFTKEAKEIFVQNFKEYTTKIEKENESKKEAEKTPVPTLSFGIFISYQKYPLYEALEASRHLLFDIAKSKKDCIAITLQKHSGQSAGLLLSNQFLDSFLELKNASLIKDDKVLLSAAQKVTLFRTLFDMADSTQIEDLFANTFDADFHTDNPYVHNTLPDYFKKIDPEMVIRLTDNDPKKEKYSKADILDASLRMLKFYVEKAGEK